MLKKINPGIKIDINIAKLYIETKNYSDAEKILLNLDYNNNHLACETLGILYYKKEIFDKSINYFIKSIEINPDSFFSNIYLGNIYKAKNNYKEAEKYYKISNKLKLNNMISLSNLTNLAISSSEKYNQIRVLLENALKATIAEEIKIINAKEGILTYVLKHKYQQACYINTLYRENQERKKFIEMIEKDNKIKTKKDFTLLNPKERMILIKYIENINIYSPKKKISNFINKNINWKGIESKYKNKNPRIVIIDNFLENEAIEELRNYALESSIWHKNYHNKNYIGSIAGNGNYSKIHHGIINELKINLPNLLNGMNFEQMWAFNYDSKKNKGINAHADFAKVNLNFWITPDKFNNSKNSSGLKIYNKAVPKHWSFDDYNSESQDLITKYLKEEKNNFIKIPYKFNRAILFDSSLIHETDELKFAESYIGRRINYTILFGNRTKD
mgnify:CR=1 FL=1